MVVLYEDSSGVLPLTDIRLEGANNRPLILAVEKYGDNNAVNVSVTSGTAFPTWRALLDRSRLRGRHSGG